MGLTRARTPCCLEHAHLRRRRLRQPRNIRFETRQKIAGEIVVFTPNLDIFFKAFPVFYILQTVFINDFCGSILNIYKYNISLILIGYIYCLYCSLHQLQFLISLSIAAFYRVLRSLRITVVFFVFTIISATIFLSFPLFIYVFFLLGYLLGLCTHFFAKAVPIIVIDNKIVCIEKKRIGEIDKKNKIIKVEA